MRELDAHIRRSRLLIALVALVGCAPPEPTAPDAAGRALEYLRTTTHEAGIDVAVAVQIYGEQSDDRRADAVVAALRARARAQDLASFGPLLERAKPPFPAASAARLPPALAGGRSDDDGDEARVCMQAMLACRIDALCREFAEREASGSILTHQAVWLLFGRWMDCSHDLDVESLRHRYAARLFAETRADPEPSDLFFERLAMLGSLGFGSALEPAWLAALRASQQPEGCFPASAGVRCHPHPTALALWALAHARQEGAP